MDDGGSLIPNAIRDELVRQWQEAITKPSPIYTAARSMISKPIAEASILPPYGTILRNDLGEHAMYLGRDRSTSEASIPLQNMVVLDDPNGPYVHSCTDMSMMKNWRIVEEAN